VLGAVDALNLQGTVTQALNSIEEFKPGRRTELSAGWSHAMSQQWSTVLQLNLSHKGRDSGAQAEPENSGSTTVSLSPYSLMGPIGRANASISYKLDGGKVEFYVQSKNVTNSRDYYTGFDFIPGVFGYKLPMEPRTVTGGFRFRF
jgi:iron complex outermembrane receptor protein